MPVCEIFSSEHDFRTSKLTFLLCPVLCALRF